MIPQSYDLYRRDRQSRGPDDRNGAATLSLLSATVWPFCLLIPCLYNLLVHTSVPGSPTMPMLLSDVFSCGFSLLPIVGIISGVIGIFRAFTQLLLRRTFRRALFGTLLGVAWLVLVFIIG
jgi:hypothetical protein